MYGLSIFLHVVAALAVFGAMTVEWLALHRLQGGAAVRQVRETLHLASNLYHPALGLSLRLRLAIGLGVVFLMTVKPGLVIAVAILPLFAAAGWIAAARSGGAGQEAITDGGRPEPEASR